MMRRSALLVVAACAVSSAAIGLVAATVFFQPAPVAGSSTASATSAQVVRQFYAVVNGAIATGDVSDMERIVAPHFLEQDPLPGVRPGREGLADFLRALHQFDPEMRLVVDAVVADDTQVVARVVQVRSDDGLGSLGDAMVSELALWGPVEIFRVAGGKIVERWSHTDQLILPQSLADVALDLPAPAPRVVTIERFVLAPGIRWHSRIAGPRLVHLEDGALQVAVSASGPVGATTTGGSGTTAGTSRVAAAPPVATLVPGGSWLVPARADVTLTNIREGMAHLVVVTFAVPQVPGGPASSTELLLPDRAGETLAGGLATDVGVGPASLRLERLTLAHNAQLTLASTDGPMLIAIDAGRLDVAAWGNGGGRVWVRRGRDGMSAAVDEATIAEGDGLLLHPGALIHVRNAGDKSAAMLILMLRPVPASTHVVADGEDVPHGSLHSTPLRPPSIGFSPSSEQYRGEGRHPAPAVQAAPLNLRQDLAAMAAQQHRSHPAFLGSCPCPGGWQWAIEDPAEATQS
jgi:predicted SnoaL-like aldol condensation-catalyzing enzyme